LLVGSLFASQMIGTVICNVLPRVRVIIDRVWIGKWIYWPHTCTHHFELQAITALSLISTLDKSPQHPVLTVEIFQPHAIMFCLHSLLCRTQISTDLSWRKAPWDSRPVILFSNWTLEGYSPYVISSLFAIAAGPRQRSHSQVRVPCDSWLHFTVPDSRLPILKGQVPVFISPGTRDLYGGSDKRQNGSLQRAVPWR
jgi:hypothetical protein